MRFNGYQKANATSRIGRVKVLMVRELQLLKLSLVLVCCW